MNKLSKWPANRDHYEQIIDSRCDSAGTENRLAYTIDAVAARTSISRTTIYSKIGSGELRARKCGRKTLILATDLELFLKGLKPMGGQQ